jgi:hypothetical protein
MDFKSRRWRTDYSSETAKRRNKITKEKDCLSEKDKTTIEYNKDGTIASIQGDAIAVESAMNLAFLSMVNKTIKDFDEHSAKYAKRMEKLTISILILTTVFGVLTLVDILSRVLMHV